MMQTYSKIHIRIYFAGGSIASGLLRLVFMACLALTAPIASPANAETALLMFEEAGCIWCAQWIAEVGPEYPITPEGLSAPLVRLDIHDALADELTLTSRPRFTPTFILVDDGTEVGRIEGYPGEDFFWGLLARLIDRTVPQD